MTAPDPVPNAVPVRAIVINLDGVITTFDRRASTVALQETLLKNMAVEDIDQRLNGSNEGAKALRRFQCGETREDEFLAACQAILGQALPADPFWLAWCTGFAPNKPIIDLLRRVRKANAGVRVIGLTDLDPRRLAYAASLSCVRFDGFVPGYHTEERRPYPDVPGRILRQSRCAPESCLLLDRRPSYIKYAREAGLRAYRYNSSDPARDATLAGELRSYGLVC